MRHHRGIARALRHLDRREGFGERADLVDLDQDGVRDPAADAFAQDLRVGDEDVIAHQLDIAAEAIRQQLPAVPVVLRHRVFDAEDRVLVGPGREIVGEFSRRQLQALGCQVIASIAMELGGRAIETDDDLLAGGVAGPLDGLENQIERRLVAGQVGGEPAFVADSGRHATRVEQLLEGLEDLGPATQRFAKRRQAQRNDHELLHVQAVVRVRTAVDDVHHRHRQLHARRPTEIAVQRQPGVFRGRLGDGQRYREHGVGAQPRLVVGAIEIDERLVDERLLARVEPDDGFADLGVDVLDRPEYALAAVPALVAIAQFDRFAAAGGGTRRDRGTTAHAGLEQHVGFDRRITSGIQDFTRDDIDD